MGNDWDPDNEWDESEEFHKVLKSFTELQQNLSTFSLRITDLNLTMEDFQFALVELFRKFPDLIENSPEGQKLVEASKKVSDIDWSKWYKPDK